MRGRSGRIGGVVALLALLLLLTGCIAQPERGTSREGHLPLGIPTSVVASCEQSVGLGGSAPVVTVWRDAIGIHVRIGHGSRFAAGSGGGLSATESALLSCLQVAAGDQPDYPVDSSGLLQLWRYSSTVLWPCFAEHGFDLGATPSRADFLRGDPLQINPFFRLRSSITEVQFRELSVSCPLLPSYLRTAAPTPFRTETPPG